MLLIALMIRGGHEGGKEDSGGQSLAQPTPFIKVSPRVRIDVEELTNNEVLLTWQSETHNKGPGNLQEFLDNITDTSLVVTVFAKREAMYSTISTLCDSLRKNKFHDIRLGIQK